ncbi:ankyrin repeat-containing domain protein [Ilyonectria sp. MPI-CAGE-AT-0026]|nr:ankyrin repeat-containing domain protein [Ilyonectria sp. MPI-CAGE-AT-0026]
MSPNCVPEQQQTKAHLNPNDPTRRNISSLQTLALKAAKLGVVEDALVDAMIHAAPRPAILSRLLGQLFVDYSSIPVVTPPRSKPSSGSPPTSFGPNHPTPDSAPAVNYTINGNIDALKELFAQGLASLTDVSDTRGYSLLRWAIYSQQWETCRFLFDQGADADYRPKALSDNSPRNKASDLLLQGGLGQEAADILTRISRRDDWWEEQNLPLLHRIVLGISGRDLVQELQENPGSVNDQDAMGRTALLWAAARGDDEAVTTLLHFNANPNIMDCQHAGPVSYAADRNHTVCTRILLAAGADPDPIIPGGYKIGNPLNCAARNANDPLLIKALLEYGANVDAVGPHSLGSTVLYFSFLILLGERQTNKEGESRSVSPDPTAPAQPGESFISSEAEDITEKQDDGKGEL